jgi:hypothetical protein
MSSPLHLDVFVVPYKPIVGLIPPMGKGEATWPATRASGQLAISGDLPIVRLGYDHCRIGQGAAGCCRRLRRSRPVGHGPPAVLFGRQVAGPR